MGLLQFKINTFSIVVVARVWYALVFRITIWNLSEAFPEQQSVNATVATKTEVGT